jgi:hypothetical protein
MKAQDAVESWGHGRSLSALPLLSKPRPNGSRALAQAVESVQSWLEERGIPVQAHRFRLRPYHMELLGLWLALTGILLPVAALGHWGWAGLALALLAVGMPLLEVRFLQPTVTALIRRPARNLVVRFAAPQPRREAIFCAHLDSKTELLDHAQREVLLRLGTPAMGLALVGGMLMVAEGLLPEGAAQLAIHWLAVLVTLPAAAYGVGMGANLTGGRLSRNPSTGAVDNGAAVAVLLALAQRLHRGDVSPEHTSVTLLFTVGEEAQMQGALSYVRDRKAWPLPTCAVNLEVVGQNGGYLLWEQDGTAMQRMAADPELNRALAAAVQRVAGEQPTRVARMSSDALAFLRQGIPAATLGSFDAELGGRGFHSALDNPCRIDPERLAETVDVLGRFLLDLDSMTQGDHIIGADNHIPT